MIMKTALVLVLLSLAICSARIVEFRYPSSDKEVTEETSSEEEYSGLSGEDVRENTGTQRERTLRASVYVPKYGFKKGRKRKYDEEEEFKYRKPAYYLDEGRGKYLTRKKTSRSFLLKDPFLKATKYEHEVGDRRKDYRSTSSYGPMYYSPPPPPPPPAPYSKPAPPKSSCGHSVLIGCTPTVTRVPCGFSTGGYDSYSQPHGYMPHSGPTYPDLTPPPPTPPSYHHTVAPVYQPPPAPLYPKEPYHGPQTYHQPAPNNYHSPNPSYAKDSYPSPNQQGYDNPAPHSHQQPSPSNYPKEQQPSHSPSNYDQPSHSNYQPTPPPSSGYQQPSKPSGPPSADLDQSKPAHHSQGGSQYPPPSPYHHHSKPSNSYQPAPSHHHRPQPSYQPYQPTYRSSDHPSQFNTPSFAPPVKEDTKEPAQVRPHVSAFPTTTSSTPAVPTVPADREKSFRLADNPIVPASVDSEEGSMREMSGDGPTDRPNEASGSNTSTSSPSAAQSHKSGHE